ncbi:type II toxin-antitoxin system Phd/YefM family antitoxin [Nocardia tengchongensis]|uniref:type II toxin-antitoxin system Phd/YefM family antitoxin n=1 Tax=Nocardia tengchongensis TaxID=2055889 RepID=UPI00365729F9
MKPMNYTEARANLASVLDSATEDLEEVVITRAGHSPAVVVALSEYEALKETAHLLGNPANARHLERSIAEHRAGGATPRDLVDIESQDFVDVDPRETMDVEAATSKLLASVRRHFSRTPLSNFDIGLAGDRWTRLSTAKMLGAEHTLSETLEKLKSLGDRGPAQAERLHIVWYPMLGERDTEGLAWPANAYIVFEDPASAEESESSEASSSTAEKSQVDK